ncbi:MAG: ATP-binding protein [Pseudomonadota bacterium]
MKKIAQIIMENEDWLIHRILHYSKANDYTKYTSTLAEAWRLSISGLSDSLVQGVNHYGCIPEMNPDDDFRNDPLTHFGIVEAGRHRERGISLSMFLGLMKYYRQSYVDLIWEKKDEIRDVESARLFIDRSFDRIEIAFCREWCATDWNHQVAELQSANRRMTNEKNAYLTVFESLSDPVIILNKEQEIVNVNHAAMSLIDSAGLPGAMYYKPEDNRFFDNGGPDKQQGMTCDRVIGCPLKDVFPWLQQIIFAFSRSNPQEGVLECSAVIRKEKRFFEVNSSEMLDISEKYNATILSLREITQRMTIKEALRESEQRYKSLFHNNHAVMLLIDPENGQIMDANPAAVKYYQYDQDTLLKMKIFEINIMSPEALAVEINHAREEKRNRFYFQHRLGNGEIRDVEVFSGPIIVADQQLLYSIIHDITDRKQAEESLRKSNQELDDFAYIASHDLREPLRGISNYATFLMEDYGDQIDAEGKSKLETLQRLCKREEDLIQSLLNYSRVGRTDLKFIPLDLNILLEEVRETIESSYPDQTIRISVPHTLPTILCDAIRIGEVFFNLISNAVKYNDKTEKQIEIGCVNSPANIHPPDKLSETISYPVYYVRDNGIGIPKRHQEKIFMIFKRLHGRDKYGGGTGAGLTIVKKIIERHGGVIWLDSNMGTGTTFYFTLPSENS